MSQPADTFGSYRSLGSPALRAARAVDRLVTVAIALVLAVAFALACYSLWDSWNVLEGGAVPARPTDAESFAALRAQNPDIVAWLTVDNTHIDYPVVRGEDNYEYLSRDATGAYAASGSIFLDSECAPDFSEPYEVIFGHHMQYGKMFGDLDKFCDQGFFDQNRTASLMLPGRTLSLETVAVISADAYDGAIFGTPAQAGSMQRIVDRIGELAVHRRLGEYSASDQLIALSTCSSSGSNARTVLVCKVTGEEPVAGNA